jgi:1,4-dihydroxy-2-naphthoyl-CoA hydrolase
MPFTYRRTVRFQDTDAAGVVYFANVLAICHEAYEMSLATAEINLKLFFKGVDFAVPIAHASVDFLKPMYCGDLLEIHLTPTPLEQSEFEIHYQLFLENQLEKPAAKALTRHVCIATATRKRTDYPPQLKEWLRSGSATLA